MSPSISIIIPCFNSQATLKETLVSVLKQNFQGWEAIIVDDGSTDNTKKIAMEWVQKDKRFRYVSKENGGLAKARNFGIRKSKAELILPLDSDNLIERGFTGEAINVFEQNSGVGVVYGNAEFFGERDGEWKISEFDLKKILVKNYIDACAVYKKSLWESVGGYDENMPHQGNEDWDFWIELGKINTVFYHLNKITFKYRFSTNSMINSFTEQMFEKNREYIATKNSVIIHKFYKEQFTELSTLKDNFLYKIISIFTN